ncbi:MAG: RNA methyltransferase, partial [Bacteriovoracia bacterium]
MSKENIKVYLGLVHGPVLNKKGDEITTSVTNLDIHDIARSCRTFGVEEYYIMTPIHAQHDLLERIVGHWKTDKSNMYNPDRFDALRSVVPVHSIEQAIENITKKEGKSPLITVTGANFKEYEGGPQQLIEKVTLDNNAILLLFGTG